MAQVFPSRPVTFVLSTALAVIVAAGPARSALPLANEGPWISCSAAVAEAERNAGIPRYLLQSIALAESGRWDADRSATLAWPWTMNAEGRGQFFPSRSAAISTVKNLRRQGVQSIDVGCMQINLRHHPDAFDSIEEAFDPRANAAYAARFLRNLYDDTGSWTAAVGRYHSGTPEFANPYRAKVMDLWDEQKSLARRGKLPDAPEYAEDDGSESAREAGRGSPSSPRAYSLRQPVVPIDYERTAALNAAFAERTGRDRTSGSSAPNAASGRPALSGRTINPASTARLSSTGTRTAGEVATFAERRQQQLAEWRANRPNRSDQPPG